MDLDIHLDSGDTLVSTSHLKVHIAKEVFQTLDISQYDVIIIGLTGYQTTGDTGNGTLDGNTGSHQRQGRSTNGSLGSGTVTLHGLRYGTDSIRELFLGRQYRYQSLLSQSTVTDLTTSGTSGGLGLTYRVAGEVVVVHVSLAGDVSIQTIDSLSIGQRSQSTDVQDLSLTTGEHTGTVSSGQQVNLSSKRTDLSDGTTVRTLLILQDHLANGLLLILVNSLTDQGQPLGMLLSITLGQLVLDLTDVSLTDLLYIGEYSLFHSLGRNESGHILPQISGSHASGVLVLFLTALSNDGVDELDHLLVQVVSSKDSIDHNILRNLVGTGFDHDNLLASGGNGQSHVGYLSLSSGGVEYKLTVNQAYLSSGDGAIEGNVGNGSGDGGTQHSSQLRAAVGIYAHYQVVQGNVVSVIAGEQRTHRTVDNTGSQNSVLAGLTLSLIETAGDLTYSVHLLFVLNAQREEIDALTGLSGSGSGGQNYGITIVHQSSAIGLSSYTSDINAQGTSSQFHGKSLEHNISFHTL